MSEQIPADPVAAACLARDALETAADKQAGQPDPAHEQFYEHAREIVGALHALQNLAGALASQTNRYGDRRILRDDADANPAERLQAAGSHLDQLRTALNTATEHTERFWSEIGHIGVEVDPDPDDED